MPRIFLLLLFVSLACGLARGGEPTHLTLYLQLVRGSDEAAPPTPQARLIGPKLSERLHAVFKWKNYWEIKRDSMTLKAGEKLRKRMSAEREVEAELLDSREITVRIYRNGKPTSNVRQSVEHRFIIAGGANEGGQSWFIVVRQTPPPDPKP